MFDILAMPMRNKAEYLTTLFSVSNTIRNIMSNPPKKPTATAIQWITCTATNQSENGKRNQ